MRKSAKILITKTVFTAICLSMLILSYLYLRDLPRVVLLAAIIVFASLGVTISSLDAVKYESIFKILLVSSIFAVLILVAYIVLDATNLLYKFQDLDALTQFVRNTKQWGVLVYIGIVIFQVIFLPIPSAIVAVIGIALFGPWMSFLYMSVGTIVGSILTFMLGKIFGRKLCIWMLGEEKTDKYAELLNNKGRFFFIIMMLFPFFPDDIICLVAGITKMSYKYFTIVVTLTRPVMIAFMCFLGSGSIIPFRGWGIPVWISLIALAFILFFLVNKIKNKLLGIKTVSKTQKEKPAETAK